MVRIVRDKVKREKFSSDLSLRVFGMAEGVDLVTSSPVQVKNRCAFTGRSRAVRRKFRASRIVLRENPTRFGLTKSSW